MAKRLLTWAIAILLFVTWIDISQPLKIKSGKNKSGSKKPPNSNTGTGNTGGTWGNQNPSYPGSNWNSWGNPNTGTGNRNPSYPGSNWNSWGNPNTGTGNRNPSYPGSNWNSWGQNYNPHGGGSSYNQQWKQHNKAKPNMKMMAGAAAAGAIAGGIGGYALGNAVGRNRIFFDDDYQQDYYNRNHNQFPNRVYRPQYSDNQRVPEDIFVNDCFNYSITEYVEKPSAGKNVNETNTMDTQVLQHVIRQLCIREYQMGSGMKILASPALVLCVLLFISLVTQ